MSFYFCSVYRQFRLCITKASGKAHTPKIRGVSIGSLREGAVSEAD